MIPQKPGRNLSIPLALIFFALLPLGCASSAVRPPPSLSATETLKLFYQGYFSNLKGKDKGLPELPFSKSLKDLVSENFEVCTQYAPDDVCGFGRSFNLYLDAQDLGENVNFANSHFKASETESEIYRVEFDLNPPERSHYYHRRIDFKLIVEEGQWVVDDIFYSHSNARKLIIQEIHDVRRSSL